MPQHKVLFLQILPIIALIILVWDDPVMGLLHVITDEPGYPLLKPEGMERHYICSSKSYYAEDNGAKIDLIK